jgi:hypothetical protein
MKTNRAKANKDRISVRNAPRANTVAEQERKLWDNTMKAARKAALRCAKSFSQKI